MTFRLVRYAGLYRVSSELEPNPAASEDFFVQMVSAGEYTTVLRDDVKGEWIAYRLDAQFDFEAVGILADLLDPLRTAQVPILAYGSFLTDHILVQTKDFVRAEAAWAASGVTIS